MLTYMNQNHNQRGFTLVEMVIVVTVIAIIAALMIVWWANIPAWSRDKARESDVTQWVSRFSLYQSRYFVYPVMPTADGVLGSVTRCLGSFASYNNKCGRYNSSVPTAYINAAQSADMMTNVTKVGNTPTNSSVAISNALVGPLVYLERTSLGGGSYRIDARFINFFEGSCPSGMTNTNGSLPASILLVMPAGVTANACQVTSQFTYGNL